MKIRGGSVQSKDGCKWLKLLKNYLFSRSALSTSVANSRSSQVSVQWRIQGGGKGYLCCNSGVCGASGACGASSASGVCGVSGAYGASGIWCLWYLWSLWHLVSLVPVHGVSGDSGTSVVPVVIGTSINNIVEQ